MAKVYVKNNTGYKATYTAMRLGVLVLKKTFGVRKNDPVTGAVGDTGYTVLEDTEHANLVQYCPLYAAAIVGGKLVKYDTAPDDALLDSALLDAAYAKIEELEATIAELQVILADTGKSPIADDVAETSAKVTKTKKRVAKQTAIAEASENPPPEPPEGG